jgi:hypothetical protein
MTQAKKVFVYFSIVGQLLAKKLTPLCALNKYQHCHRVISIADTVDIFAMP